MKEQSRNCNNILANNRTKLLIIKDSFADVVVPFLYSQFAHTDVVDLRYFSGSIRAFIKKNKPNIVIVLYHIGRLKDKINLYTHTDPFDFR